MSDESTWDETPPDQPEGTSSRSGWLRTLKATSTRRALLLTALGGLLIAGLTTALPFGRQTTRTGVLPRTHLGSVRQFAGQFDVRPRQGR